MEFDYKKLLKLAPGYYDLDGNLLITREEILKKWSDGFLNFDDFLKREFNCTTPGTVVLPLCRTDKGLGLLFEEIDETIFDDSKLLVNAVFTNIYCRNLLYNCHNLKNVYVNDYIADSLNFFDSTSLENVYIGSKKFDTSDGVVYSKDRTVLYYCPAGRTGTFIVPDSVKVIEPYAFNSTRLDNIVLPNGLEEISLGAFDRATNLKSIFVPNSVKRFTEASWIIESNVKLYVPSELFKEVKKYDSFKEKTLDALLENGFSITEINEALKGNDDYER